MRVGCAAGARSVLSKREEDRPPEHPPLPKVSLPGPRSVREDGAGGRRGWGGGGQSLSWRPPPWESAEERAGNEIRSGSCAAPSDPRLPQEPYPSHPSPPARGLQNTPTRRPLNLKQARNSPKPGVELGQGRPDAPGPWQRVAARGREGGVLGPPLDVKALKGPGSPAPHPNPAPRLPRSQSTFTLVVRSSQLLQMFPGPKLESVPPARAASAPEGRTAPPLYRETLPSLGGVGPGKPTQCQGARRPAGPSRGRMGAFRVQKTSCTRTYRHERLLLWRYACTCICGCVCNLPSCIRVRSKYVGRGLSTSLALNAQASFLPLGWGPTSNMQNWALVTGSTPLRAVLVCFHTGLGE